MLLRLKSYSIVSIFIFFFVLLLGPVHSQPVLTEKNLAEKKEVLQHKKDSVSFIDKNKNNLT